MNTSKIWYYCTQFMWDERCVTGLEEFLKSKNVHSILDCAGGTGFPSIDLKKRGWNITYSDGNEEMFKFFKEVAQKEGVTFPICTSDWRNLTKTIPQKFDAILCRGNSLVYVDTWDTKKSIQTAKEGVKESLSQFYKILNKGGLLYIDIFSEKEFNRPEYPFIEKFNERMIGGEKVSMTWEINHDYLKKLRTVKITLHVGGDQFEQVFTSFLLKHEELEALMKEVGFTNIQKVEIKGEDNYTVYIGYKLN